MAARKKTKFKQVLEGKFVLDPEEGPVLWLLESKGMQPAYGVTTGGLVDARLVGKQIRVFIEEL